MGSLKYKNRLPLRDKAYGTERRENLVKEVLKDSTPFPNPVVYEDIDQEFKKWVKEELLINFENEEVPTIALFTNQRFSEYMQTWQNVDNKKNLQQNFKLITRENNPKNGTQQGQSKNIPGDITFLMQRVEAKDKNNRVYYIDYRMKQPFNVDLTYKVSLVTNKYELLNNFNLMVNEKFKAIDCYIRPNGHFMPMKLNDISDESEYNIDDRQFYSQSYNITVMAYIITEDDFIVEEKERMRYYMSDINYRKKTYAEIDESPKCVLINDFYYQPVIINVNIDQCISYIKFHMDTNFMVQSSSTENIRSFKVKVNDIQIPSEEFLKEGFELKEKDEVVFYKIVRYKSLEDSEIIINGINKTNVLDKNEDEIIEEITIN